jgi:phosphate transport system permease protein
MSVALQVSPHPVHSRALARRRRVGSHLGWVFCGAGFVMLGIAMTWIIGTILVRGASALSLTIFIEPTQGNGGGLLNAIEGTAVLALGTLILAVPLGVAAGIYVAEYRQTRWAKTIRFFSDTLVGVPSIVLGYAGYVILVQGLGWQFSAAAACITLAIMCLPYICRSSELAFASVSLELREAAYAMGADERQVILGVCLPVATPGVLTGILLALAISVGETAPLLYTAGWSNYLWDGRLVHSPIAYLTYAVWTFINEPFASANALAYAAALLVTSFVLLLNVASRLILRAP